MRFEVHVGRERPHNSLVRVWTDAFTRETLGVANPEGSRVLWADWPLATRLGLRKADILSAARQLRPLR